jgi:hypothetical protein
LVNRYIGKKVAIILVEVVSSEAKEVVSSGAGTAQLMSNSIKDVTVLMMREDV